MGAFFAGDNGSIWFWDWKSGHNFQQTQTIVQPGKNMLESFCVLYLKSFKPLREVINVVYYFHIGSLDSEAGIYASCFDITGTRLVTCEADKTIKMWKEDEDATPETHPINFKPPKEMRRF